MSIHPATIHMKDRFFAILCYLFPLITMVILAAFWVAYLAFFVLALVYVRSRPFYVFHLVQSLLCFGVFFALIIFSVILGSVFLKSAIILSLIGLFDILLVLAAFLATFVAVALLALDKPIDLPGLSAIARRVAVRASQSN